MLKVEEIFKERKKYAILSNEDRWINAIIDTDAAKNEIYLLTLSSTFTSVRNKNLINRLLDRYYVSGMIDIGSVFVNTNISFTLYVLSSKKPIEIKVSNYWGDISSIFRHQNPGSSQFEVRNNLSIGYLEYLSSIEQWVNSDVMPTNQKRGVREYVSIPYEKLTCYDTGYYTQEAIDVRKFLDQENLLKLEDVADIYASRIRGDRQIGHVLSARNAEYPLDLDGITEGVIGNVKLQKGDILLSTVKDQKAYLINEELKYDVFAGLHDFVVRAKTVCPEYLCLYLNSSVAQSIMKMLSSSACCMPRLTMKSAKEIPIIAQEKEDEEYKKIFLLKYYKLKDLKEYEYALNLEAKKEPQKLEDVLAVELATKVNIYKEEQVREFITNDIKELNACFNSKAYKATLILAGSILEAVLIDWLSEINGIDYFEEDYMVTDRRNGRSKRADLVDYIDAIKYIERPRWIEEARKSHEIRKKRNLVHAKLCIDSNEVNEETCIQVIDYLKDVLKTRSPIVPGTALSHIFLNKQRGHQTV